MLEGSTVIQQPEQMTVQSSPCCSVSSSLSQQVQRMYVMLHQQVMDLETQAYQAQQLVAVHQKQETRSRDDPVEIGAMTGAAKCKRKQPGKSGKKSRFAVDVTSSSQSSGETSNSDSEGDTEALVSTSSQKRCWAPRSGRLVSPFTAKRESWTVWFAQFEAIADDNDWSGPERLSMLLPKLQGAAGEYVFEVLPKRIRSDYRKAGARVGFTLPQGGIKVELQEAADRNQSKAR